jgi:hypothetical protein
MRRLERLIGAALVAAAKARCVPALVTPGETCEVGAFGQVGTVAGHDFSWAHYDFKPTPGDPLHSLPWPRIVIFERLPAGRCGRS